MKIISWLTDVYRILRPAGGNLRSLHGAQLDAFMREMYPPTAFDAAPNRGITLNLRVGDSDSD